MSGIYQDSEYVRRNKAAVEKFKAELERKRWPPRQQYLAEERAKGSAKASSAVADERRELRDMASGVEKVGKQIEGDFAKMAIEERTEAARQQQEGSRAKQVGDVSQPNPRSYAGRVAAALDYRAPAPWMKPKN